MKKFLLILILLNSCSTIDIDEKQDNFLSLNKGQFSENVYNMSEFDIFSVKKIINNNILTVYIEGDGQAWLDRFTPSLDPTPSDPVAFKLALEDNSENVIYLARPCQYIMSSDCNKTVWTSLQYSETILETYKSILSELSKNYKEIHLVGYSGGAAIAIYLASIEDLKIKSIRTVAGNINPDEITLLLNLSGYKKSVNFYSIEDKIKDISQTHYYGTKDKVIPLELHLNFEERNLKNKCIKIEQVSASHNKGWDDFWKKNYQLNLNC
ncbi:hypothetical protein IDH27_01195 [Pelagibacterales bacterium SAG-MED46]|nr:hypothetical protein [Pelagibacterales bacterium SAG-MED46]